MIHRHALGRFVPMIEPPEASEEPCVVIAVRGSTVVIRDDTPPHGGVFLGVFEDRHCWAVDAADDDPEGGEAGVFADLRRLWGGVDETTWTVAGRAVQLIEWQRTHRYCGRCGESTQPVQGERALRCRVCGLVAFPRLAPAIIVLVERDDGRALLARNKNFPMALYSCLAGFVEPGETLEGAVRREVHEEVGVLLDDVRYFGSQPWPFPHSLMVGFHARWQEGDLVLDETEIADAGWFAPSELPTIPGPMSIARRLIDDWLARVKAGRSGEV